MISVKTWIAFGIVLSGIVLASGCTGGSESPLTTPSTTTTSPTVNSASSTETPVAVVTSSELHGHVAGAHGGIMVSLGRDSYHAEAVFEKGGILRLYTLGKEESRVIDVEQQTLKGFVKAERDSEAQQFTLNPEPQDGDAEGRTSQFVGTLPEKLWGLSLEVTVPNIVISGERFRLGFKSTVEHDEGMPGKVADDEERKLYLTPGGKYTEEDIKANGSVTASVKFKGLKSTHDMLPKSGDRICPVTRTKANPQFTWVVNGKPYEFCCPPCVDEFVKMAKSTPDEIRDPADYIKAP